MSCYYASHSGAMRRNDVWQLPEQVHAKTCMMYLMGMTGMVKRSCSLCVPIELRSANIRIRNHFRLLAFTAHLWVRLGLR
jgi:hypothetical protein